MDLYSVEVKLSHLITHDESEGGDLHQERAKIYFDYAASEPEQGFYPGTDEQLDITAVIVKGVDLLALLGKEEEHLLGEIVLELRGEWGAEVRPMGRKDDFLVVNFTGGSEREVTACAWLEVEGGDKSIQIDMDLDLVLNRTPSGEVVSALFCDIDFLPLLDKCELEKMLEKHPDKGHKNAPN